MIYDRLENAIAYGAGYEELKTAIAFLTQSELPRREDGRHELSDGAFASVQTYDTKPARESLFESHRRFVDVQYVIEGEEWIYVSSPTELVVQRAYDAEEDCVFYGAVTDASRLLMRPGFFLLLFPHDAHMPGIALNRPSRVRKAVVKLPVRER